MVRQEVRGQVSLVSLLPASLEHMLQHVRFYLCCYEIWVLMYEAVR